MCNNPASTSSQRRKMRIPTTPAHPVIPAPAPPPRLVRFVIHYITNRAPFRVGAAQRGLGRDRGSPEIAALKAELLREQISKLRDNNLREADTVVDAEVVSAMLKTLANKLAMLLRQKLEVELGPRMVGKNHAEIAIEGRLIHDEIGEILANNTANYQNEELPIEAASAKSTRQRARRCCVSMSGPLSNAGFTI
jgi:hypothetical protein